MSNFSDTTIITMSDQENKVVLRKPNISRVLEGWKEEEDKDNGDLKRYVEFSYWYYQILK